MTDAIIKVENLSKQYRLGQVGTGALSHDINRLWYRLRGKEDPYLKIGEENDRTKGGNSQYVWALQDINFEIRRGEVLGIIGRNGAGKSTLLKILSRTTAPTRGSVKIKGRIASLLEVGTGFHPELTGRDNIFLNGAILGMTKAETKRKFDQIVDFSGVERYIDTPVKRYSSGMYVRLAFAVAAHLEPEILIVDEVLAVGDAEFQRKALGKMQDVSSSEGRTVLFVSHNMAAVSELCNRGIVLNNGIALFDGPINKAVASYQNSGNTQTIFEYSGSLDQAVGNENIKILKVKVLPLAKEFLTISSGFIIEVEFYNYKPRINLSIGIILKSFSEVIISEFAGIITQNKDSREGVYSVKYEVQPHLLNAGNYYINLLFGEDQRFVLYDKQQIVQFEILNETIGTNSNPIPGFLRLNRNATHQFIGKHEF